MSATTKERPLSLRAQAKQRKLEKQQAKKLAADELAALRAEAKALAIRMPADFSDWGVIRTRAYVVMAGMLTYRAGLGTVKKRELRSYVEKAKQASSWPLEFCQMLANLNVRNRIFGGDGAALDESGGSK